MHLWLMACTLYNGDFHVEIIDDFKFCRTYSGRLTYNFTETNLTLIKLLNIKQ